MVTLRYLCNVCDFVVTGLYHFRQHLAQHSEFTCLRRGSDIESRLSCGYCSYMALNDADFSTHIENHLDERPYKCGHCEFSSYQRKGIQIHLSGVHPEEEEIILDNRQFVDDKIKLKQAMLVDFDPQVILDRINLTLKQKNIGQDTGLNNAEYKEKSNISAIKSAVATENKLSSSKVPYPSVVDKNIDSIFDKHSSDEKKESCKSQDNFNEIKDITSKNVGVNCASGLEHRSFHSGEPLNTTESQMETDSEEVSPKSSNNANVTVAARSSPNLKTVTLTIPSPSKSEPVIKKASIKVPSPAKSDKVENVLITKSDDVELKGTADAGLNMSEASANPAVAKESSGPVTNTSEILDTVNISGISEPKVNLSVSLPEEQKMTETAASLEVPVPINVTGDQSPFESVTIESEQGHMQTHPPDTGSVLTTTAMSKDTTREEINTDTESLVQQKDIISCGIFSGVSSYGSNKATSSDPKCASGKSPNEANDLEVCKIYHNTETDLENCEQQQSVTTTPTNIKPVETEPIQNDFIDESVSFDSGEKTVNGIGAIQNEQACLMKAENIEGEKTKNCPPSESQEFEVVDESQPFGVSESTNLFNIETQSFQEGHESQSFDYNSENDEIQTETLDSDKGIEVSDLKEQDENSKSSSKPLPNVDVMLSAPSVAILGLQEICHSRHDAVDGDSKKLDSELVSLSECDNLGSHINASNISISVEPDNDTHDPKTVNDDKLYEKDPDDLDKHSECKSNEFHKSMEMASHISRNAEQPPFEAAMTEGENKLQEVIGCYTGNNQKQCNEGVDIMKNQIDDSSVNEEADMSETKAADNLAFDSKDKVMDTTDENKCITNNDNTSGQESFHSDHGSYTKN